MLRCWRSWQLVTLEMLRGCSASLANVPGQLSGKPDTLALSLRLRVQLLLVLQKGQKKKSKKKKSGKSQGKGCTIVVVVGNGG
jgi:hypothetical protein